MELEGFPVMEDKGLQFGGSFQRHSEPSTPTQYGAVRTVRTQGLFSYREDYRVPSGPPSPQPQPWLPEPSLEGPESGRASPLRRDGAWFMQLLHTETKRMEGWCKEMEREAEENDLSEESEWVTVICRVAIKGSGMLRSRPSLKTGLVFEKSPGVHWSALGSLDIRRQTHLGQHSEEFIITLSAKLFVCIHLQ